MFPRHATGDQQYFRLMKTNLNNMKLTRKHGRVLAGTDDGKEQPVKIVWARPITGRGREVSVLSMDNKEIAMLDSLDQLDAASRQIAEKELEDRYLVPRITRVNEAEANYGNRYWNVETDRGPRRFLMKDPNANVTWITDDRLIIRDTLGNRYEIESFSALDAKSRAQVDKII